MISESAPYRPPDSRENMPVVLKYQKTSKNKLQHEKEAAQTVVRAKLVKPRKIDLTSLTNKLEKAKVVQGKVVGADVSNNPAADYCNVSEISTCTSEDPVTINPPDKKPMASPRTTPANHASNDTRSALSTSSSMETYQLWQCAQCQTVNEAHYTVCEHCKLLRGKMATREILCHPCQLMMFLS